ncbi:MAG: inhibitor of KinA sporulation pathway (predicted exonuclease) [bacterium]|jgi:inhibitor of KinA sporulation pathway (predicted exonuclease)
MSDITNYDHLLIVDLEATCCDRKSIPRNEMEIIEIGAVMFDINDLQVVDEFQTFILPNQHPDLTKFCTDLTSITQSMVDSAPDYPTAIKEFQNWLSLWNDYVFCSWGDYDRNQFDQDCQFHQIPFPIQGEHINIKKLFAKNQGLKKGVGMAKALNLAGLELHGTHHRGIDDVRNMARLVPYILGEQHISFPEQKPKSRTL